jgi:hypothetical protein
VAADSDPSLKAARRITVAGGVRKQGFDAKSVCDFTIVQSKNGG